MDIFKYYVIFTIGTCFGWDCANTSFIIRRYDSQTPNTLLLLRNTNVDLNLNTGNLTFHGHRQSWYFLRIVFKKRLEIKPILIEHTASKLKLFCRIGQFVCDLNTSVRRRVSSSRTRFWTHPIVKLDVSTP